MKKVEQYLSQTEICNRAERQNIEEGNLPQTLRRSYEVEHPTGSDTDDAANKCKVLSAKEVARKRKRKRIPGDWLLKRTLENEAVKIEKEQQQLLLWTEQLINSV